MASVSQSLSHRCLQAFSACSSLADVIPSRRCCLHVFSECFPPLGTLFGVRRRGLNVIAVGGSGAAVCLRSNCILRTLGLTISACHQFYSSAYIRAEAFDTVFLWSKHVCGPVWTCAIKPWLAVTRSRGSQPALSRIYVIKYCPDHAAVMQLKTMYGGKGMVCLQYLMPSYLSFTRCPRHCPRGQPITLALQKFTHNSKRLQRIECNISNSRMSWLATSEHLPVLGPAKLRGVPLLMAWSEPAISTLTT